MRAPELIERDECRARTRALTGRALEDRSGCAILVDEPRGCEERGNKKARSEATTRAQERREQWRPVPPPTMP